MQTEILRQNTQFITSNRELTAFDKIVMLSVYCRFKDCTHTSEAGCAVLEALDNEVLDNGSYKKYLKMNRKKTHLNSTVTGKEIYLVKQN